MKLLLQIAFLARMEARYFAQHTRLLLAAAVITLVPAVYALIYLSAVWDPESHTRALAVGIVNQDAGVHYREHRFNIGKELEDRLLASQQFGFRKFDSEDAARDGVRRGHLAFALVVPSGFSAQAIPGAAAGDGKLVVIASQGNNYQSASIARHFADTVGKELNQSLNERRWALVLRDAAGSQSGVERLRDAATQLHSGARELRSGGAQLSAGAKALGQGSHSLHDGVEQLASGVKQLGAGLRTMDSKRPHNSELTALRNGSEALVSGHAELGQGLGQLHAGAAELRTGVGNYRTQTQASFFVPESVNEGLGTLHEGLTRLETGLLTAQSGQAELHDGAKKLHTGVVALTTGMRSMNLGVRSMVEKLPEDQQLDKLADASEQLAARTGGLAEGALKMEGGIQRLEGGIALLVQSLPANVNTTRRQRQRAGPIGSASHGNSGTGAQQWRELCSQRHPRCTVAGGRGGGFSDPRAGVATACTAVCRSRALCGQVPAAHDAGVATDLGAVAGIALRAQCAHRAPRCFCAHHGAHRGDIPAHDHGPHAPVWRRWQGVRHDFAGGATLQQWRGGASGTQWRVVHADQPLAAADLGGASPQGQHV